MTVMELTMPWLGEIKREKATRALAAFDAQIRLKGDAEHCVRGHRYDRHVMRGGRMRKLCSQCAVIVRAEYRERMRDTQVWTTVSEGSLRPADPRTSSHVYTRS